MESTIIDVKVPMQIGDFLKAGFTKEQASELLINLFYERVFGNGEEDQEESALEQAVHVQVVLGVLQCARHERALSVAIQTANDPIPGAVELMTEILSKDKERLREAIAVAQSVTGKDYSKYGQLLKDAA